MGQTQPQLDLQQDWMLSYSREENGVTTLGFYRQRDTNDAVNDTAIQVKMLYLFVIIILASCKLHLVECYTQLNVNKKSVNFKNLSLPYEKLKIIYQYILKNH